MDIINMFLILFHFLVGRCYMERSSKNVIDVIPTNDGILEHPGQNTGTSTPVYVHLHLSNLNLHDHDGQQYLSASFILRLNWRDLRLSFKSAEFNGRNVLTLPDDTDDKMWIPDVFFVDTVSTSFPKVARENKLVKVNSTGHVWYLLMGTVSVSCPQDLHLYPFDRPLCNIHIESFRYMQSSVQLKWASSPHDVIDHVAPHLILNMYEKYDCTKFVNDNDGFPCIGMELEFARNTGYYFLQIFAPSILEVALSWMSFWVDKKKFVPRLIFLAMLLVAHMIHTAYVTKTTNHVPYIKAADIWEIVCFLFIILAAIETWVVNIFARKFNINGDSLSVGKCYSLRMASLLDSVSAVAFPLMFLIFMMAYFGVYRG